ncbi:MAG: cation:proton antiporter, partial [Verrucomicrobiota bacterium]
MHSHSILTDLAWIMFAASIAAIIFHKLKIPSLLGYLAAGFALGPHLGIWHSPVEIDNVQELAELGVIFLMFYIGLEFDFSRLKASIGPALTAISLQTLLMLFLGIEAARWIGLSTMDGWFLGGLLSISSSMVSVKLLRENGLFKKPHANFTVGILVLEDILAILLLVLLGGMATQGSVDAGAVGRSALFIGIFMVAVFLLGKLGTQRLIGLLKSKGSKELVTMATLGLIFAVSLLADRFSFSWALGGFMAGTIFSRSEIAHQIEELTEPLRDLFSALFFVSVGMLINPSSLWENAPVILVLSAIVIVSKFSSCWLGLFLGGRSAMEAGRASIIKSQIGEFSFVIAAIGAKYGATSSNLQSIASGVAFVTILATPALIKNEKKILGFIGRVSPKAASEFTELYSNWHKSLAVSMNRSGLLKLAGKPVALIAIHFLLINLIIIGAGIVSQRIPVPEFLPMTQTLFQQSVFILSLLLSLPFLVDTMRNFNVIVFIVSDATLSSPAFKTFSQ